VPQESRIETKSPREGTAPVAEEKTMKRIIKGLVASSLFLAFTASIAWAGPERLSSELRANGFRNARAGGKIDVIVRYKSPLGEAHHRRIARLGGSLHGSFDGIQSAHYSIPRSALKDLEDDPDVKYVSAPCTRISRMSSTSRGKESAWM